MNISPKLRYNLLAVKFLRSLRPTRIAIKSWELWKHFGRLLRIWWSFSRTVWGLNSYRNPSSSYRSSKRVSRNLIVFCLSVIIMPGSDFSLSHLNFFNSLSLRMMRFLKNIEFLIEVKEMRNIDLLFSFPQGNIKWGSSAFSSENNRSIDSSRSHSNLGTYFLKNNEPLTSGNLP